MTKENPLRAIAEWTVWGTFFRYQAPKNAKMTWVDALKPIGRVMAIRKAIAVPTATATAIAGEINIAINIATWLASVTEPKGPKGILTGENRGMAIPTAMSNPAIVSLKTEVFFIFISYHKKTIFQAISQRSNNI
jgi:hypothetical protein